MNEKFDENSGALRKREELGERRPIRVELHTAPGAQPKLHSNGHSSHGKQIDFWVILDLLAYRWVWLLFGTSLFAGAFFYLGLHLVTAKFIATAHLLRYETPLWKDYQSTPMSSETFASLIRSPELLARVGTNLSPPVSAEKLGKSMKVDPEVDSDVVKVLLVARQPQEAVDSINLYASQAVEYMKELQASQARSLANTYLTQQVAKMEEDIIVLEKKFRGQALPTFVTNKLAAVGTNLNALSRQATVSPASSALVAGLNDRLNSARSRLAELSVKYTDLWPEVKEQKSVIDELHRQIAIASTNQQWAAQPPGTYTPSAPATAFNADLDIIRMRLLSLEESSVQLKNRQREAEMLAANPPGMVRVLAPATLKTVQSNLRWLKIAVVTIFGGALGFGCYLALIMLVELTDKRLRTVSDVQRVTELPVLTTLGDLERMAPEERTQWAFRTWTLLQGRLSASANHGLVCGITSSGAGEGRSTWINLLAEAASLTGFRVLTIATKPSPVKSTNGDPNPESAEPDPEPAAPEELHEDHNHFFEKNHSKTALATNVLASPMQVTERLTGPNSQPMVHIPLPGWVWNLERRKQWREALNHWRQIDNIVILVELPNADLPEAVLLGSNLPNLIWLAENGTAHAAATRAQLQTLRHARCNLVGAVLNRESARSLKKHFPRWVGCFACLAGSLLQAGAADKTTLALAAPAPPAPVVTAPAVTEPPPAIQSNAFFSIISPAQRAAWQQHLTLGPGDVLNFALWNEPTVTRTEVTIAPDGKVGFLDAQDVLAAGLTVDELRQKVDQELGKYRRAPHTIITPVAFRSKKYYMLGKVMTKGVYTLDRPLTVLEAIARAHGFENGLVDRNVIDLADFQRSFLMRGGKRFALDFERLFQQGDLSQNIAIEPGDYLYFPSTNVREVYVVGEVRLPGPATYTAGTTIIAAISARGGYTDRAYKARVLVVRGSLNNPETFAVDTHAILDGKAPDFQLRPKDVIYVSARPFIRVEELADLAITAFIQSFITSYIGVDVVKPYH